MKSRLGPIGVALVLVTTLVVVVPTPAVAIDTTSTTGVRIITVPVGADTVGVAMEGDAIALNRITGQSGVWPGSGPLLRIQDDLPPGGGGATIEDMNANLEVVGGYRIGTEQRAYFWSEAGGVVDIPSPPGLVPSTVFRATGISDDGWIVGQYRGEAGACFESENTCGFLAVPNGAGYEVTTFNQPAPFATFSVNDIELATIGGDPQHVAVGFGLVWSDLPGLPDNGFSLLDTGTTTWVDAYDVNRNGQIVGWSFTTSTGVVEAGSWSAPDAALTHLGFVGSDTRSEAYAITDSGTIVGFSGTSSLAGTAVVWDPVDGIKDLGHIASATTLSVARGISADGIIVGESDGDAVIWDLAGNYEVGSVISIDTIPNQTFTPGEPIFFTVTSSGAQSPYYELFSGQPPDLTDPPANASLGPTTGDFFWFTEDLGEHVLTVSVSDAFDPSIPAATETFTVTIQSTDVVTIVVGESILVGDTVEVRLPVVITVQEAVAVSDDVTASPPLLIQVSEAVGIVDQIAVRPPIQISITEAVAVTDDVTVGPSLLVQITESVAVTDQAAVLVPILITISESVGVTDQVDTQNEDPNGDLDGDGITNSVDTERGKFSNLFSDVPVGGTTFGEIMDRSQQVVGVADAADNAKGVTITTGTGPANDYAVVELCLEPMTIHVWSNANATFTCGSLTVDVDAGLVTLVTSDGAEIDVGPGSSVYLDDDGTTVTVEVLTGTARIRIGELTIDLESGDIMENPGNTTLDHDEDGLTTAEEGLTGTNPIVADTDDDGLVDGIDPTWLDEYVAGLPNSVFSHERTGEKRFRLRIAALQKVIAAGERDDALEIIAALASKIDGCGSEADNNDWITGCGVQAEFNELLEILRRNVAVMDLPDPPPVWEGSKAAPF